MTWYYQGEPADPPEEAAGFIYCITDKKTHKFYIGKKLLNFTKTKYRTVTLKNGTKKKKKIKELNPSDWQEYYGSNDAIKDIIESEGTERFHREIICWCETKGEMGYWESYYIYINHAIIRPEWFYNGWVSCKVSRNQLKRLIEKLDKI